MTSAPWSRRRAGLALLALILGSSQTALAADADADALALEPEPTTEASPAATKIFVEGALGRANQRYDLGSRTIGRATIDGRHAARLTPSTQGTLSGRIDATDPGDERIDGAVFSLREAYVGWQDAAATQVVEFGRINLREGPGYGYNPTDFFRDHALRTFTTVNPLSLREQRLGSVMLRGQRVWGGHSVSAVFSPKLESTRSDSGFNLDLGATNARDRGLVTAANRWSETVSTQLTMYKEARSSPRLGASLTALVSDAAVVHAEWSTSDEPDLLSRALMLPADERRRNRAVAGLTYTTMSRLSITAEYQYNGFAVDRKGWQALAAASLPAQGAYFRTAADLQDNAARDAVLLYAVQRDLGLKNLELTVLARFNRTDSSRMLWTELRYRMDRIDVALQMQQHSGVGGSEFGITRLRSAAQVLGTAYF